MSAGIAVWGGSVTVQDKQIINRVRKCADKINGAKVPHWGNIYEGRIRQVTNEILRENRHPLHRFFQYLLFGRRLPITKAQNNRFKVPFIFFQI